MSLMGCIGQELRSYLFAYLISRISAQDLYFFENCLSSGELFTALSVLTIIGAVLSLFGIIATIVTLLLFK